MPSATPTAKAKRVVRAPTCQVCLHPERWRIELLKAGGASLTSLAKQFALDRSAIQRHWLNHVTPEAKASYLAGPAQLQELAAKAADSGASVLDNLQAVRVVLFGFLTNAAANGDARTGAAVAGQLTNTLEKIARITGELSTFAANTINIQNNVALADSPAFLRMQGEILRALAPFPEARAAVVAALRAIEDTAPSQPKVIEHVVQ